MRAVFWGVDHHQADILMNGWASNEVWGQSAGWSNGLLCATEVAGRVMASRKVVGFSYA